ncbi:hypothetical protein C5N14_25205 [Micromonospora sp. MW-13]|uniref:DUF6403 family protein n=1 Tax=Micromonospora sp. MW-13 TaxID=2094022 RepID=UPI000ED104DF|nr:DUF6403 family protein [Micromonospora sp. MW-13]RGC66137.1 hypothetical protein C5N14_25205 [Micromonospora sp. MW-13]
MSHTLPIWLVGGLLLVGAGFVTALLPWWRARAQAHRTAWSTARAEIDSAAVTRDAAASRVPEAEQLLTRAELIAGGRGGTGRRRPQRGSRRGRPAS